MIKNKKRCILTTYFLFTLICIGLFKSVTVNASTSDEKGITITGKIDYFIGESGEINVKNRHKVLINYPITLFYEDENGKKTEIELYTGTNGVYSKTINTSVNIKKVWIQIQADNEACSVKSIFSKVYKYTSKKVTMKAKQKKVLLNVRINKDNVKGAINIARVINNTREYVKAHMGIDVDKVTVYWTSGKGENSDTSSVAGFMRLSGKDHDECDESVICHEYGHWVYGRLRRDAQFKGGTHFLNDNKDKKLAYSEGLATFFGQTVLNSDCYYDGNPEGRSLVYSIETPTVKYTRSMANEVAVSTALWDCIDKYSSAENWDEVCNQISTVLQGNVDAVNDSGMNRDRFLDCTIQDFYNKFFNKNINENSDQAYQFWNVFKHNGMQFDTKNPVIGMPVSSIVVGKEEQKLDFRIYDNVKVSKVEIYINRNLQKTYYEPTNDISYTIPRNVLKKGRNKLSIVAYDYANNIRTIGKNVSKLYPVKDINVASNDLEQNWDYHNMSYRQPYSVAYVDVFVESDTNDSPITTASLAKSAIQEETELETFTNDSILQELADQYSLTLSQQVNGSLEQDASTATQEVTISDGNDCAFLQDDTLGNFEITLTDPNGTTYTNAIDPEDTITENESKTQAVLNMGSSGLMVFHPLKGTWKYSIKNRGTAADYSMGIFTKLSAPTITNEDELLKQQDGYSVVLKGNVILPKQASAVSGSAITIPINNAVSVATGSAITAATGSSISIKLTGETTGFKLQDIIGTIDDSGNFSYAFPNLPDDHYQVELCTTGPDGTVSWTKTCDIIVDSSVPQIEMEDDYEFYTYAGKAIIAGRAINASDLDVYLNGELVLVYGDRRKGNALTFGTEEMKLNPGDNQVRIVASTETGKTVTKEINLHSDSEEFCFQNSHQPVIESVLFNGKENPVINKKATIDVKLTDNNTADYKVFAVCDGEAYDFTPNGDHFTLEFDPKEMGNGSYEFTVYADSRWKMSDERDMDITIQGNDSILSVLNYPDDITIEAGETASLKLNEVFSGMDYEVESNLGTIKNGNWSFSSKQEGEYEVILRAYTDDAEELVNFSVFVEPANGSYITLEPAGGTLSDNQYYVSEGKTYGKLPIPTKTGYTFLGWFTLDQKYGGFQILDTSIVKQNDAKILYAHWSAKTYNIILDANGGEFYISAQKSEIAGINITYGNSFNNLISPYRPGYFFLGWYTEREAGEKITSNSVFKDSNLQRLYAHWTEDTFTITFYKTSKEVTSKRRVVFNTKYGKLPEVTNDGYVFQGWYIDGKLITEDSIVSITYDKDVHALWKPLDYEVTFDANGGNVTTKNKTVTFGYLYGELPIPTREGYTFAGWRAKDSYATVSANSAVGFAKNHTLYAQWGYNPYKVTLDTNGGKVQIPENENKKVFTVWYDQAYGNNLLAVIRNGYEFDGWYTQIDGGEIITEANIVKIASNHTLYAHWKKGNYKVGFVANGGTVSTNVKIIDYKNGEQNKYGELPVTIRNNYIFTGWFTTINGGTQITADSEINFDISLLYARWTAKTYELSFDSRGGETTIKNRTVTYGESYGILPVPTRMGYSFSGWYLKANPVDVEITNDSKVTIENNQELYARWRKNSYLVTLNTNGGYFADTNAKNTFSVEYEQLYGSNLKTVMKSGYEFDGWYTQMEGGDKISPDSSVNIANNHTLYAHWKSGIYKVNFDANGGTVLTTSKSISYADNEKIKYGELPIPSRENYIFAGWFTEKNEGNRITSDSEINLNVRLLYARWTGKSIQVNFDANGGELNPYVKNMIYGSSYGILPTPTKTGYTFTGWYTQATGGTQVLANSIVNIASNHILYAHWTGSSYQLILDGNGGVIPNGSKKYNTITTNAVYGATYGNLVIPVRTGYDFTGWFTKADGGDQVTSDVIVMIAAPQTLYAHWKAGKISINFDANGGTGSVTNKDVIYQGTYGELPIPTRENHTFAGWYTQRDAGIEIKADSLVTVTGNQTLYAKWKGQSYEINLDTNDGELTIKTIGVISDEPIGKLPIPTKVGYTFVGWFTDKSAGTKILESSLAGIETNHTIYAHWDAKTFNVTLSPCGGTLNGNIQPVKFGKTYGTLVGLPIPVYNGYSFDGWYTKESGGDQVTNSTLVMQEQEHTLYAHWKGNTYTLYLNANGGTVSVSSKNVVFKEKYGELPVPTQNNYIFMGWYDHPTVGKRVTEESIVNIPGGHYLYAHWKGARASIAFDALGGDVTTTQKEVFYGDPYGELPIPTKKGYTFFGWYTKPNVGNTLYGKNIKADTIVDTTENQTLYAVWLGKSCEVTLDANGGIFNYSGTTCQQVQDRPIYGTNYNFNMNILKLSRTGYKFAGWYTKQEGGEEITNDTVISNSEPQTIYAHWKPEIYSVYFAGNNGTVSVTNRNVTFMEPYGTLPVPVREHYQFIGWFTDSTYGTEIKEDSKVTIAGGHYLYAHWKGDSAEVNLDANNGTVDVAKIKVNYGEPYGTLPVATRPGYRFYGWCTQLNKDRTIYGSVNEKSAVSIPGNHTLYAYWLGNNYSITLDGNGGNFNNVQITQTTVGVTNGETYNNISGISNPVQPGYNFVGWYTETEGGQKITSSSIVNLVDNQTLYAHWKEADYQVSFYASGGNMTGSTKTVTYKSSYGSLPTPTKEHYVFQGWYTQEAGGNEITAGSKVSITSGQTLYARWRGESFKISFDANEGTVSQNSKIVYYDENYGSLPVPVRRNYDFLGWYTFEGNKVEENTFVRLNYPQQLVAKWRGKKVEVTFQAGDGTAIIGKKDVYYGQPYYVLPTPDKPGYVFQGWYTSSGQIVTEETLVDITQNEILYAHWKALTATIYFYWDTQAESYFDFKEVAYEEQYGKLPDLKSQFDNIFIGWFDAENNRVTAETMVKLSDVSTSYRKIRLYAHWARPNK